MKIDRSRLIIGFRSYLCDLDKIGNFATAEDRAWSELTNPRYTKLPGLQRVVRRLKYLNAVVAAIDPIEHDRFRDVIRSHDSVAYCDPNYLLKTADLSESVAHAYRPGTALGRVIRRHHLSASAGATLGAGTRVALLDSGCSPHPFLPSFSSSELLRKKHTIFESVPTADRIRFCRQLEAAERTARAAIGTIDPTRKNNGPAVSDRPDLADEAERIIERFGEDRWTEWEQAVRRWLSMGRKDPRPSIPCYRHLPGWMRFISPLSRSFVEKDLSASINDVMGHGSQMAGFVAALSPNFDNEDPQKTPPIRDDHSHDLDLDLCGIAPYSELLILKCCHELRDDDTSGLDGCMLTLIDALGYLLDQGAHVAYIGFAINDCDPRTVNAVGSLLTQVDKSDCIIVAPAGNDKGAPLGLAFPAASGSVRAIAALTTDPNQSELVRADYSPVADKKFRERVAFAAYGGDDSNRLLTTSIDFGFRAVSGTSVAAAIASGVFAAHIGAQYTRAFATEYGIFIGQTGQIDIPQARAHLSNWIAPSQPTADIHNAVRMSTGSCVGSRDPDADTTVGAGVIRA